MALNPSGAISLGGATTGQSIAVELGLGATSQISLNCTNVRTLAGVPSGAIVMPTNFWGKSAAVPFGCATYTTAGTYSFVVPTGVNKICVVCVGAGGGGVFQNLNCQAPGAGGGGALSYSNCIPTTPGETLTVVVGAAVAAAVSSGPSAVTRPAGGDSLVRRGPTNLVLAKGGSGGSKGAGSNVIGTGGPGGAAASGVGAVRFSGGNAGTFSGGGASGYAGDGGNGVSAQLSNGNPGSGGGGGGGYSNNRDNGTAGGGVGLIVQGPSGAGGIRSTSSTPAQGGSGGAAATTVGGAYGGGGGGNGDSTPAGGASAVGGVRIIYGGTSKTYPNNSAP